MNKKIIILYLIIAVIIVAIITGGFWTMFHYLNKGKQVKSNISPEEVGKKITETINKNLLPPTVKAEIVKAESLPNLYKLTIKIKDQQKEQQLDIYTTEDGKYFFAGQPIDINNPPKPETPPAQKEIIKSEKPDVKVFVMSYCPFGLQIEKAYLPVNNLLKHKADMGIYFVYYAMHGKKEIDENLKQYCIQKNEKEKYADYLSCFVLSGDTEKCSLEAKIDKTKTENCIKETDAKFKITESFNNTSTWINGNFPPFDVHKDLNETYQVQGSPTIIINGVEAQLTNRSPEKLKELICSAFINPPTECQQKLSTEVASPGIGATAGNQTNGRGNCEQ